MLSLFKSQQPNNLLLFLLLMAVMNVPSIFVSHGDTQILSVVGSLPRFLEWTLSFLIIAFQAIWFNYIFTEANYLDQKTLVPAAVWAVLSTFTSGFYSLGEPLFLQFLILAMMHSLVDIRQKEASQVQCFHAGVLNGILIILHPPFVVLIPFMLASLYTLRTFRLRDYFLAFLGVFLALFWAWGIFYITDHQLLLIDRSQHLIGLNLLLASYFIQGKAVFILLLAMGGAFMLLGVLGSAGFKRKKNVTISISMTIGLLATWLISNNTPLGMCYFLIAPMVWLISILMLRIHKKMVAEVLFGIFVLSFFIVQFFE